MNIILCGYQNSGKTTTAKLLTEKYNYNFLDTDQLIIDDYKKFNPHLKHQNIREIHQQIGNIKFRQLENKIITTLTKLTRTIISLGGGTLNNPQNQLLLKKTGKLIYLKISKLTAYNRMLHQPKLPSFINPDNILTSFNENFAARSKIYCSIADLVINADQLSPEEIINLIPYGQ